MDNIQNYSLESSIAGAVLVEKPSKMGPNNNMRFRLNEPRGMFKDLKNTQIMLYRAVEYPNTSHG